MTEQDRESFETIIEAFGKEAQMIVAVEELATERNYKINRTLEKLKKANETDTRRRGGLIFIT